VVLFLDLLEQVRVVDGNHSLVCKGLRQGDFLVGKGAGADTENHDAANGLFCLDERHEQAGLVAQGDG
jgi:hypothetical protein